ncbi:30S ribosomal protein S18 [Patescibacteria group bacterium]|nr:30S ribosomal protein S18 [Patescibacteria group bacterium]
MTCHFCQKNTKEIDLKDVGVLSRFISGSYKIKNRRKTGLCAMHQRKTSKAIKKARQLGIMPSSSK